MVVSTPKRMSQLATLLVVQSTTTVLVRTTEAWITAPQAARLPSVSTVFSTVALQFSNQKGSVDDDDGEIEEWNDFEDLGLIGDDSNAPKKEFILGDDDIVQEGDEQPAASADLFAQLLQERSGAVDWTAIQTRQFSLGSDIVLSDYVGNMGFDEVTDWEYYLQSEEDDDQDDRQVVQPNPFDSSK